jgi:hypothetical protein
LGPFLRHSPDLSTKEIDNNTQSHQSSDYTRANVESVFVSFLLDKADSSERDRESDEASKRADEHQRGVNALRIRIHTVDETRHNDSDETEVFEVECHRDASPTPV